MNRLMSTVASAPEQVGFEAEAEGPGSLSKETSLLGSMGHKDPAKAHWSPDELVVSV